MSTLEQWFRDHGVQSDDATFYATHAEKWLRARATLTLAAGFPDDAAVIDNAAYEARERVEA